MCSFSRLFIGKLYRTEMQCVSVCTASPHQYRRGIRLFPHIIPIAFPLIFPLGFGLAMWLFHFLFPVLGILLLAALVLFVIRAVTLGSPGAAWNSMRDTGQQWQQRFTTSRQQ